MNQNQIAKLRAESTDADRHLAAVQAEHVRALAAVESTEQLYDADPTDQNGIAVNQARQARDLAALRVERAQRRATAAKEQLEREERAQRIASVRAELGAAREAALEDRIRFTAAQEIPAALDGSLLAGLRELRRFNVETRANATAEITRAGEVFGAAVAKVATLEAQLGEMAPELAPDIDAAARERAEHERAELLTRADPARFYDRVGDSVQIMVLCRQIIAEHEGRIVDALDDQREAARIVGGAPMYPPPGGGSGIGEPLYRILTAFLAYMARPDEERPSIAAWFGDLLFSMGTACPASDVKHAGIDRHRDPFDVIRAYLSHANPHEAERAVNRLAHQRALDAGDPDALAWEEQQAQRARREEERDERPRDVRTLTPDQARLHRASGGRVTDISAHPPRRGPRAA